MLNEPIRFERIFLEKVWGGRALERTPGIALPPGIPVGETWELVDRAHENSVVGTGPYQGRTLRSMMEEFSRDLLGRAPATPAGRFPVLIKYIDATASLSVQVHPSDETAARLGQGAEGKTEAWFVLDAAPGACLYAGVRPDVSRADLERAADGEGVVELLNRWEVSGGDCMLIPGGTVHAIGAGVTLLEVQQNSDTTYRMYDWGRLGLDGKPRETHLEQALAVASVGEPVRPPVRAVWAEVAPGLSRAPLVRTRTFSANGLRVRERARLATGRQFQVYAVVEGSGTLTMSGSGTSHRLELGDCWLVPASAGYHFIEPREELGLIQFLTYA